VGEHYRLVELVQRGDADEAAALMRHHIVSWKPLFSAALKP
jgi:DNA-binding GntR family transcriptional regulator